jgi:hypothetical protein
MMNIGFVLGESGLILKFRFLPACEILTKVSSSGHVQYFEGRGESG